MPDDQKPVPPQHSPQHSPQPSNASPQSPTPNPPKAVQSTPDAGHIPITEEMDSAKWTLPPIIPIAIAVVAVVIVVAVVSFLNRQTPSATGSITKVISADQQGNVIIAVHIKFDNMTEKPLWIKNITSELEGADGKKYKDNAASSSDLKTYFQAFPQLGEGQIEPLKEEQKIAPKGSHAGMTVFSYPVDKAAFDARKSLTVRIDFYDRASMFLKQ
jgi:hypothetical protein